MILILQNSNNPAPPHIIERQRILTVRHLGFDNEIHDGTIIMHEEVAEDTFVFFELALDLQFPIEKIVPISDKCYQWNDELSMADNNTSGFNYRTILGTGQLSNHALGKAFDVNPKQNIYLKRGENGEVLFSHPEGATYDPEVKGTLTKDHPLVIFMKERGWVWGGEWQRGDGVVDYQHFEKG